MRSTGGFAGLLGLLMLFAQSARAARPLDTEDTGTVAHGHVELELGHAYTRDGPDDASTGVGVLGIGVTPNVEARVEGGFQVNAIDGESTEAGVSDTLLGVKWRVSDETRDQPAFLAAGAMRLPTGDATRGLGSRKTDVVLLLGASKVLGDFNLVTNVGYVVTTRDRALDYWIADLACEYAVARGLVLVGEMVSAIAGPQSPDTLLFRTGLVYGLGRSLKLDAAVAAGATRAAPDFIVTTGITILLY